MLQMNSAPSGGWAGGRGADRRGGLTFDVEALEVIVASAWAIARDVRLMRIQFQTRRIAVATSTLRRNSCSGGET